MKRIAFLLVAIILGDGMTDTMAQQNFNGLGMGMGTLSRLSRAKSRSISPENFTGEKGEAGMATSGGGENAARELGQGWKVSPFIRIEPGETFTLAEVDGEGAIQQIWMTPSKPWRLFRTRTRRASAAITVKAIGRSVVVSHSR